MLYFLITLWTSCQVPFFDKDYYEKISGIQLPEKYKIIETVDNEEYLTITSIQIDSIDLLKMIKKYKFDTVPIARSVLMGETFLSQKKPTISLLSNIFIFQKSSVMNHCTYLIDLNQQILWAEIVYNDWAGN